MQHYFFTFKLSAQYPYLFPKPLQVLLCVMSSLLPTRALDPVIPGGLPHPRPRLTAKTITVYSLSLTLKSGQRKRPGQRVWTTFLPIFHCM